MGLRNIEERMKKEAAIRDKGSDLALKELESMITSLKSLNEQLRNIEKKYGNGFYDQLALQILEIGKNSLKDTGGVMSFAELIKRVQELYKGHVVSINDIQKSLEILEKNNLLAKVEVLDSGFKIIHFITQELSPDMNEILKLANKNNGQLSREQIMLETGWNLDRLTRVMQYLEEKQIIVKDENLEGITYYFPGI